MAGDLSGNTTTAAMASMMARSMDAIVTTTRRGMITGWSPVAVDVYGYSPEEMIGRDSSVLLPAELLSAPTSGRV